MLYRSALLVALVVELLLGRLAGQGGAFPSEALPPVIVPWELSRQQ